MPTMQGLRHLGAIRFSGAQRFVARDHFVVDVSPTAKVKIAYVGLVFEQQFLGKVEEHVPPAKLELHATRNSESDSGIIEELAISNERAVPLAYVWEALSRQPNGETGDFPIGGKVGGNCYALGLDRALYRLGFSWSAINRGWGIGAEPTRASECRENRFIFSL